MHQGHNLVLEAQQKHAKRTATDVHVPLSDKISMTSFENAKQQEGVDMSNMPWYKKLQVSSGTTDAEVEVTQARALHYESDLISGWAEEARAFIEIETEWDLMKSEKEINAFRARSAKLEHEDSVKFIPIIALSSIANRKERKRRKGNWKVKGMLKESTLLDKIFTERNALNEELQRRRFKSKTDIKNCFKNSAEILKQLGDKIDETCSNIKQNHMELTMKAMYQKKLRVGRLNMYDSHHFMHKKFLLVHSENDYALHVKNGHLTCEIIRPTSKLSKLPIHFENQESLPPPKDPVWQTMCANHGPQQTKRLSHSFETKYLDRTVKEVDSKDVFGNPIKADSAFGLLARGLDGLHTRGPRMHGKLKRHMDKQRDILTNRLMLYGYIRHGRDNSLVLSDKHSDKRAAIAVKACFKKMIQRSLLYSVFYYEMYRPPSCRKSFDFVLGWTSKPGDKEEDHLGCSQHSFGIGHNGKLWHKNESKELYATGVDLRRCSVIGCLLDKLSGCISFVVDGRNLGVAFGAHSEMYGKLEQMSQGDAIRRGTLVPAISLKGSSGEVSFNFGGYSFLHRPKGAYSCESYVSFEDHVDLKKLYKSQDTTNKWYHNNVEKEKGKKENELVEKRSKIYTIEETLQMIKDRANFEKLQAGNSLQDTIQHNFKTDLVNEEDSKSWSNFPPAHIKHERAIRVLQRFIRTYVSRARRRRDALEIKKAVDTLSRFVDRKKDGYKFSKRNVACLKVQKIWRGKKGRARFKMLSAYNHKPEKLVSSAIIIQSAWRQKMARRTLQYKKRNGIISVTAVKLRIMHLVKRIQRLARRRIFYKRLEKSGVVLKIQKMWRGFSVRNNMDPKTYAILQAMKANWAKQKRRISQAIVIQKTWRRFSAMKMFKKAGKMRKKKRKKRRGKKKGVTKSILPLAKVLDTIAGIFEKKVKADIIDERKGNEKDTLPEFVADFFEHMYGIPALSSKKKAEFRNGIVKYEEEDLRTRWFGTLTGWLPEDCHKVVKTPYHENAIDTYLSVLQVVLPVDSIEERMDDDPCHIKLKSTLDGCSAIFKEFKTSKVQECYNELRSKAEQVGKRTGKVIELDVAFDIIMRHWYILKLNATVVQPPPEEKEEGGEKGEGLI
jgi:hypothetical protein